MPTTFLNFVFLLFFVAPGLLFDILQGRRRPPRSESAFRETSRVLLSGVIFSSGALLALAVLGEFWPSLIPNVASWINNPDDYIASNFRLIGLFAIVHLVLSMSFAAIGHRLLTKSSTSNIAPISGWHKVFRDECPVNTTPVTRVHLVDGTLYIGKVHSFTTSDAPTAERELVLGPPLWTRNAKSRDLQALPHEWQRVVLPGEQIKSLSVAYWETE